MSDEFLKFLVGLLALASTIFSVYAANRAKRASEVSTENAAKVEANTVRIEELKADNKELKELVESINLHVNGKMDDLLKVSIERAELKGAAQEREARDKKDAEAAQAILIAKADEVGTRKSELGTAEPPAKNAIQP